MLTYDWTKNGGQVTRSITMPETPEELTPSGQFENLGAVEVVPAPAPEQSIELPKSKFAHLGAYQVRAGMQNERAVKSERLVRRL